jgi:serine/threonine protein kinase
MAQTNRIGKYEIGTLIGKGGMGEVYQATQTDLQRSVAIKFLGKSLLNDESMRDEFIQRFYREGRLLSSISHPNVVRIFDMGEYRKTPYIVMELLTGKSLATHLREGVFAEKDVIRIVLMVLEGLAATHAQGIIHRDIKPANIHLTLDGRAVLTDFGIARSRFDARLTQVGGFVGAPGYAAPEQYYGGEGDVRSDVFAVGVLMFEMLCGKIPEDSHGTPYLVSDMPQIPKGLKPVIEKCIASNPNNRYATAQELKQALERTRSTTSQPDGIRFPKSSLAALAVAGVVIFLLLIVVTSSSPRPVDPVNSSGDSTVVVNESAPVSKESGSGNDEYVDASSPTPDGGAMSSGGSATTTQPPKEDSPSVFSHGQANTNPWEGERFPQTRTEILTPTDVSHLGWTNADIRYAINEIYARNGYDFKLKEWKAIFDAFSWYRARVVQGRTQAGAENAAPALEKANLAVLTKLRGAG